MIICKRMVGIRLTGVIVLCALLFPIQVFASLEFKTSIDTDLITLPEDVHEYNRLFEEYLSQEKNSELSFLKVKERSLIDPIVQKHFRDGLLINDVKEQIDAASLFTDLSVQQPVFPIYKHALPLSPFLSPSVSSLSSLDRYLFSPLIKNAGGSSFDNASLSFFTIPSVHADDDLLIPYYTDIETSPVDFLLYYISQYQNSDGSVGNSRQYEFTVRLAMILSQFQKTDNDQYTLMLGYLRDTEPVTVREKALQVRFLMHIGDPYEDILHEITSLQKNDGGFPLSPSLDVSDIETTLEVALSFLAADHGLDDSLPLALYYVVSSIPEDGGMFYGRDALYSDPNYPLINKTVQMLQPFEAFTLRINNEDVVISEIIDSLFSFVVGGYEENSGFSSHGFFNDVSTLYTLHVYGEYNDLYTFLFDTSKSYQKVDGSVGASFEEILVSLQGFSQPDLVVSDMQFVGDRISGEDASMRITIQNNGYVRPKDGILHVFVDNVDIGLQLSLSQSDVEALSFRNSHTIVFDIPFSYTKRFLGNTSFQVYLESKNDMTPIDNWLSRSFSFASSIDSSPSFPLYYSAFASSFQGGPSLTFSLYDREDQNRVGYVLGVRELGEETWSTYVVNVEQYIVGGIFSEGTTYEVIVGVFGDNQEVLFFPEEEITTIRMSATPEIYEGSIKGDVRVDNLLSSPQIFVQGGSSIYVENGEFEARVPNGSIMAWVQEDQYDAVRYRFNVSSAEIVADARLFSHLSFDDESPTITSFGLSPFFDGVLFNQGIVTMTVQAQDTLALDSVDIFYFDPDESLWLYVTTASFLGEQSRIDWFVPHTFLGEGYQFRAIARDFRGNVSIPFDVDVTSIRDGTPPSFSFSTPVSSTVWQLGEEHSISWETQAINNVNDVTIDLLYGEYVEPIYRSRENTGEYLWSIPYDMSYASDDVYLRVSGEDNENYRLGVQYTTSSFHIVDPSSFVDAPWGNPVVVTDTLRDEFYGGRYYDVVSAYDDAGILHVVYQFIRDELGDTRILTQQLHYLTFFENTWSSPQIIFEEQIETDNSLTGYRSISDMQMLVGTDAFPRLLWRQGLSQGCESLNTQDIFFMEYVGDTWSDVMNVSSNETDSRQPDMTISDMGVVTFIWSDGPAWTETCDFIGEQGLSYVSYDNGEWGSMTSLFEGTYPSKPQLVSLGGNDIDVVYRSGDVGELAHVRFSNNAWSLPDYFMSARSETPQLVLGENGTLHYVFREFHFRTQPVRSRIVYAYFDGDHWSTEEVSPIVDGYEVFYPSIMLDGTNSPYIMYERRNTENQRRDGVFLSQSPGGEWLTPISIQRDSQFLTSGTLNTNISSLGQVSALWLGSYQFHPEIFYNQADVSRGDSTIRSFGVSENVIFTNSSATQTIQFVLDDARDVDEVRFLCNHRYHREQDNPACGYIQIVRDPDTYEYTPQLYTAGFGNDGMDLKMDDFSYTYHHDGSLSFSIPFTLSPAFGEYTNNIFSVIWYEHENEYVRGWFASPERFDTYLDENVLPPPVVGEISFLKDTVLANDSDIQFSTVTFQYGEPVDEFRLYINHDWYADNDNPRGGLFLWRREDDVFMELGGNNYGGDIVTLLPELSSSFLDEDTHERTIVFAWSLSPTYPQTEGHTLSYLWQDLDIAYSSGWKHLLDESFRVVSDDDYIPPALLDSVQVLKEFVARNNIDTQEVTFVFSSGEQVDDVRLYINHDWYPDNDNPRGGLFIWRRESNSFSELGGNNYGSQLVTLLPDSHVVIDEESGEVRVTFIWSILSDYPISFNNTLSYLWQDSDISYSSNWKHVEGQHFSIID